MNKKALRLNISIYPELVEEMDKWATKTERKRSDFIREALRYYIRFLRRQYGDNQET